MKKNNSNKHKIFYCYTLIAIIFSLFIISCGSVSLNSTSNIPVDIYVGDGASYWKNGE